MKYYALIYYVVDDYVTRRTAYGMSTSGWLENHIAAVRCFWEERSAIPPTGRF